MLIIDDILKFPFTGLMWVFQEIYDAAEQDLEAEAETLTLELQQLYYSLESGNITEAEFDRRENELLERLEQIEDGRSGLDDEYDDEDE